MSLKICSNKCYTFFIIWITLCVWMPSAWSILNGDKQDPGFHGVIKIRGWYSDEKDSCTATLLTNMWAITARHCFLSQTTHLVDYDRIPVIGVLANQQSEAHNVYFHPTVDVALLHFNKPFSIKGSTEGYFKAISTVSGNALLNRNVTCVGYGTGGRYPHGVAGEVPLSMTAHVYEQTYNNNSETKPYFFAADPDNRRDSTNGDSGSSCFIYEPVPGIKTEDTATDYTIVGVLSQGVGTNELRGGRYIENDQFRDWVTDVTTTIEIHTGEGLCLALGDRIKSSNNTTDTGFERSVLVTECNKNNASQRWRLIRGNINSDVQIQNNDSFSYDSSRQWCLAHKISPIQRGGYIYYDIVAKECLDDFKLGVVYFGSSQFWKLHKEQDGSLGFYTTNVSQVNDECAYPISGTVKLVTCSGIRSAYFVQKEQQIDYPNPSVRKVQKIQNAYGRCLQPNHDNSALIDTDFCVPDKPEQQWAIAGPWQRGNSSTYLRLFQLHNIATGKCLATPTLIPYSGLEVVARECSPIPSNVPMEGGHSEAWLFVDAPNKHVQIQSSYLSDGLAFQQLGLPIYGPTLCIDTTGAYATFEPCGADTIVTFDPY